MKLSCSYTPKLYLGYPTVSSFQLFVWIWISEACSESHGMFRVEQGIEHQAYNVYTNVIPFLSSHWEGLDCY